MVTSMIHMVSLAKPSPCILGTNPLRALWTYLRDFVNIMDINRMVIFAEYSKSKPLASLKQYIGPVYDEDPHFRCLEPTQHSWVVDPSSIDDQLVTVCNVTWSPP